MVAALNGTPHRTLGDIDVLVDEVEYKKVITRLRSNGYSIEKNINLVLTGQKRITRETWDLLLY